MDGARRRGTIEHHAVPQSTSVLRFDTRRSAVCGVSPPGQLLTQATSGSSHVGHTECFCTGQCLPEIPQDPGRDCGRSIRKQAKSRYFNRLKKFPTLRGSGISTRSFPRKHWVFARFVSGRLLRIPRHVLRFYYAASRVKTSRR